MALVCSLETHKEVTLPAPVWDDVLKKYPPGKYSNRRRIENFVPIRLMINVDGNISFTLNRFTLEFNTSNLIFET